MKPSTAMLRGFKKVNGEQITGALYRGVNPRAPLAVCALGAFALGKTGCAEETVNFDPYDLNECVESRIGVEVHEMNDEGMDWQDIVGILQSEGL